MKQKILSIRLLPQTVAIIIASLAAAAIYLFRLGSFIGHSPAETQTAAANASLRAIAGNPLNLPYKLADYLTLQLPFGSVELRSRLTSAVIALACAAIFYLMIKRWHGVRNASLSTILFVTAGWLLQTGRFGAALIMLTFMVLGLIAMSAWISAAEPHPKDWVLMAYGLAVAVALLIPAGLWFVLASVLIVRPRLREHIRQSTTLARTVTAGLPVMALALVAVALVRHPELYRQWLGLPAALPDIMTLGKQTVMSLTFVVARGPYMPEVWLAHTPMLEVATAALLMAGAVFYARHHNNPRVHLLAAFLGIGTTLVALHGAPALAYTIPVIYLVIGTGLTYLLHQWLTVFPRNPFARSLALLLIGGIIVTAVAYHTQRYFVAWRQSPDTIAAYRSAEGQGSSATGGLRHSNLIQ